jgi:hypothetical protein
MRLFLACVRLTLGSSNCFPRRQGMLACLLFLFTSLGFLSRVESAGGSVSGNVEQIAPPPSVVLGALESNTFVRFFSERTGILLNQNVSADITQPGFVGNLSGLTPGVISANQFVDSYLLHADAIGNGRPIPTYQGSVIFDRPILGILVQPTSLSATDSNLGSPLTTYNPATGNRGFEWPSTSAVGDSIQLSADLRTITIVLKSESQYDQIRVITTGVPEPASLTLAACCVAVVLMRWRRGD